MSEYKVPHQPIGPPAEPSSTASESKTSNTKTLLNRKAAARRKKNRALRAQVALIKQQAQEAHDRLAPEYEKMMIGLKQGEVKSGEERAAVIARDIQDILAKGVVSQEVAEAVDTVNDSYSQGAPLAKIAAKRLGGDAVAGRNAVQAELALRILGCRSIDELKSKVGMYAKLDTDPQKKKLADEATAAQVTLDLAKAQKLASVCRGVYYCVWNFAYDDRQGAFGLNKEQIERFFSVQLDGSDTTNDKMAKGKIKYQRFSEWNNKLSQAIVEIKDLPAAQICEKPGMAFAAALGRFMQEFGLAQTDLGMRGVRLDREGNLSLIAQVKEEEAQSEEKEKEEGETKKMEVEATADVSKPEDKDDFVMIDQEKDPVAEMATEDSAMTTTVVQEGKEEGAI